MPLRLAKDARSNYAKELRRQVLEPYQTNLREMFHENPDGQTHFCNACEVKARGGLVTEQHTCGETKCFSVTISNIGMLRQWLNEERITDSKKMVSNEDIIKWLQTK